MWRVLSIGCFLLAVFLFLGACKKDGPPPTPPHTPVVSRELPTPGHYPVVAVGDSIMNLIAPALPGVTNLAVGGYTTDQILHLLGSYTADVVIIEGGVNNLASGMATRIIPDYRAMLASLPDTRIIVVGMIQAPGIPSISTYNIGINQACLEHPKCIVAVRAQTQDMTGLLFDGLHPNPQGVQILADIIKSYL